MIKGKVYGSASAIKKMAQTSDIMEIAMISAMQKATLMVHETAVKNIQDNSDGTPAIRYAPKRVVNVSNPGDYPNTDTGRLAQSIEFAFEDGGRTGLVGSNLRYAAHLEFGTQDMAPRPWLSTAMATNSEKIAAIIQKAVNDGLYKAMGVKNIMKDFKKVGNFAKKTAKKASSKAKKISKSAKKTVKKIKRKLK